MLTKALAYIGIHEWMLPLTPLKSPSGDLQLNYAEQVPHANW